MSAETRNARPRQLHRMRTWKKNENQDQGGENEILLCQNHIGFLSTLVFKYLLRFFITFVFYKIFKVFYQLLFLNIFSDFSWTFVFKNLPDFFIDVCFSKISRFFQSRFFSKISSFFTNYCFPTEAFSPACALNPFETPAAAAMTAVFLVLDGTTLPSKIITSLAALLPGGGDE